MTTSVSGEHASSGDLLPVNEANHPWETAPGLAAVEPLEDAPRLGFAGIGRAARDGIEALVRSGAGRVAAVADPDRSRRDKALELAPGARDVDSFRQLMEVHLDGIVIATPNALHVEQVISALERGLPVFCLKPLARTIQETREMVAASRAADRLLAVDLPYRQTEAAMRLREVVARGELGEPFAGRFVFHSAAGPDKAWFYDRAASGGGCVLDHGTDLIDLALWLFGARAVKRVSSRLFERGRRLEPGERRVEDYALIEIDLDTGAAIEIACSWGLPAGSDAVIEASIYGTCSGAAMHNVAGSTCDFTAELYHGSAKRTLCRPPDEWEARPLLRFARRIAGGRDGFDGSVEAAVSVADVIDRVYGT